MNMKKHFLHFVLALMFILTPLCIFADVDVSDMSNWDDDDWSEFLDGIQETPDGWDGTPATYGEDIHDCAVYDGSDGTSHDPTTTYITDADGNLVTLTYSDVYDENGNFIYSYEGKETDPDAKADIEARIAEFFESMKTEKIEEALSDILSRYFDAAKELEEAKRAGADAKTIAEIESKMADLRAELDALCAECGYSYSISQNGNFGVINNKEGKTVRHVGDPVVFSTGEFVIDDEDITIRTRKTVFSLQRHYSSEMGAEQLSRYGMFGHGWASNLETRIIAGYSQEAIDALPAWEQYVAELEAHDAQILEYLQEDSDCSEIYAAMQSLLETANSEFSQINALAQESEDKKTKNQFAAYGKPARYAENCGLDTVFYCQDDGSFLVFRKNSDNSYALTPAFPSCAVSLAVDTSGYCISYGETGEKRLYSEYGLPKCFTFKNGGKIEFFYDSAQKLKKITVDSVASLLFTWSGDRLASVRDERNGRTVTYDYADKKLSSVRDWEGDCKKFVYNSTDLLEKQIKADGSFVAFEYANSDGVYRTVKTTNEEGKSEYFHYDRENRTVVYIDYDGSPSLYAYDERGRTVHEEHADGTFTDYEYDDFNHLIAKKELNGKTEFVYDTSGRMIQKKYPDGSFEKWTYGTSGVSSFTDRDGVVQQYYYNAAHQMTDIFRAGSLLIHSEYNSDGSVHSTTDCRGNTTFFSYDTFGNLIKKSVCAKDNPTPSKVESWTYDSQNRIISAVDAHGKKTTFSYSPHKITCKTEAGLEIESIYSSRKLLLTKSVTDTRTGEKRRYHYDYDRNKNCIAQYISGKDVKGKEIPKTKLYDFTYTDGGKNQQIVTYAGALNSGNNFCSEFEYGAHGMVARSQQGFYALDTESFVSSAFGMDYLFEHNAYGLLSTVRTDDGLIKTIQENADGKIISETENGIKRKQFEYSPAGRLLRQKTENSGVYEYRYDSAGFCEGWRELGGTLSSFSKSTYYPDGKKKSSTDRNGMVTHYVYDEFSHVIEEYSRAGTKIWNYDALGRLIRFAVLDATGKILTEDRWNYVDRIVTHYSGAAYVETIELNSFGEIISITDGCGNKTLYIRDIFGRVIEEKNANGGTIVTAYNALNQVAKCTFPDGSFLSYAYDEKGNCIEARDAQGLLWQKTFDGFSRVKTYSARPFFVTESYSYDQLGNIVSATVNGKHVQTARFSHDRTQSEKSDFRGNTRSFEYDGFSRLRSHVNSLGKRSSVSYFKDGLVQSKTDFNGTVRNYSYSDDYLSTLIHYSDGSETQFDYDFAGNLIHAKNSTVDLYFRYDTAGRLVEQYSSNKSDTLLFSYNQAGQMTKITAKNRTISYEWGKTGELLKVEDSFVSDTASLSSSVRFVYDSMACETLRVYDSGESVHSLYDAYGRRILQVGYSANILPVFVEGSVYNELGQKLYSLDSNLCLTSYSYDDFGRLSLVSYPYTDAHSEKMKYAVADAGLFFISETVSYQTLSVSDADYAKIQQLCALIGLGSYQVQANQQILTEEFTYDENNNILSLKNPYGTILFSYDSENRLIKWGETGSADYDDNGNMIHKKTSFSECTYAYTKDNRLSSAIVHSLSDNTYCRYTNAYDAFGRRYKAYVSGSGTQKNTYIGLSLQLFDSVKIDSDESVSVASSSKNRTSSTQPAYSGRYVFIDDGEELDTRSAAGETSENFSSVHPLYDTNGMLLSYLSPDDYFGGSVSILMTDSVGSVKNEIKKGLNEKSLFYDAFGEPISDSAQFGFCGKHFNSALGMYDFGYRDYEPSPARFSSVDPIHDGVNWYAYCNGNPVCYYDTYGLKAVSAEAQHMQDMGHVPLGGESQYTYEDGKDKTDYADEQGCLVTAIAEALSALTGVTVTNDYINSHSEFFDGNYNIDWAAISEAFGSSRDNMYTAKGDLLIDGKSPDQFTAFAVEAGKDFAIREYEQMVVRPGQIIERDSNISTVTAVLEAIAKSETTMAVIAQVAYAVKGDEHASLHFVGINATVTMINGIAYATVTATSKYDTAKSLGQNRASLGWVIQNGKVYVPLSLINRVDAVTKPQ